MLQTFCHFLLYFFLIGIVICKDANFRTEEDNEFAEFEKYDDEPLKKPSLPSNSEEKLVLNNEEKADIPAESNIARDQSEASIQKEDDATVETDSEEFSHLLDNDEFEGFDKGKFGSASSKKEADGSKNSNRNSDGSRNGPSSSKGDLKFADVPVHLTTRWDSFYLEIIMIFGLSIYFFNFIIGKSKNGRLANAWFQSHKELLEREFHVVGDDGTSKEACSGTLLKESEHMYSLWCSGRVCVEGMLVELKFIKRQDIISLIAKLLKPAVDRLQVKVTIDDAADIDGFVCAVVQRRRAAQLIREHSDLTTFCPERKVASRFELPETFCILSEIGEATQTILDHKVCAMLTRYEENVEFIHISDQYTGPKPQQDDAQTVKLPQTKRVLICSIKVGRKGSAATVEDMESLRPLFQMLFYILEKMRKVKLSKEAKAKAEKNRVRASESVEKLVHSQRQEAAQLRREEKRKADKERLLVEEDPERARRLEARVEKAEAKRKGPKMKMMKMKSM